MRIGIVGSESAKFTKLGKKRAKYLILKILSRFGVTEVVSGDCHLGGIDRWAARIGRRLGLAVTEFPPKTLSWESGYKPRNIQIAKRSDKVYCITVDKLPWNYTGMRFKLCYHCGVDTHVKSGGCWTMKEAKRLGKEIRLKVIHNY
jgi:hypothetical protein